MSYNKNNGMNLVTTTGLSAEQMEILKELGVGVEQITEQEYAKYAEMFKELLSDNRGEDEDDE